MKRGQRREEILQTLARLLEDRAAGPITTARLAAEVGVSEAALYRHFPSKAKIYDALVDFIEESIFPRITSILSNEQSGVERCRRIAELILAFSAANPGLTRILSGHALVGENERLRVRVTKFFDRIETQIKQILREANLGNGIRASLTIDVTANQIMTMIEGHMSQFVRSNFEKKPTAYMTEQWGVLRAGLFR